jgi:hypothetical protein
MGETSNGSFVIACQQVFLEHSHIDVVVHGYQTFSFAKMPI